MSDWGPNQYLSELIANAQAATIRITKSTAVMISDRYGITAAHSPLDENNEITPGLTAQNMWGEVRNIINVFYTVDEDFAIIELESPFEHNYSVKLADENAQAGDVVFAVGHPYTVANAGVGWAVSFGERSGIDSGDYWIDANILQVEGGNSGGGVFNENGELIGIVSVSWYVEAHEPDAASPYYLDNGVVDGILDVINFRNTAGTIKLEFIKDFLAQYEVENKPKLATEADLPENLPDPYQQILTDEQVKIISTKSATDKLSNVLISNKGATSKDSNEFKSGGSGTIIHDGLILTVAHALDGRYEASIGFYDGKIDADAKTYAISHFGDFGLVASDVLLSTEYPVQEIAVSNPEALDPVYFIGGPRRSYQDLGGWIVSTGYKTETNDTSYVSGLFDSGGHSGGGVFDFNSDLVGTVATGWGGIGGSQSLLVDRQDPHNTSYAPTIPSNWVNTGSSDFFYLKSFVSEQSPSSININSTDYFVVGAIVLDGSIFSYGWQTKNAENNGFITKYDGQGNLDKSWGNDGTLIINLSQNDQIKSLLEIDGELVAVGETQISAVQNIFEVQITSNGLLSESNLNSPVFYENSSNTNIKSVFEYNGSIYIAGNTHNSSNSDIALIKITDGKIDNAFGDHGRLELIASTSTESVSQTFVDDRGIFLVSTSDALDGIWSYQVNKFTLSGEVDTSFGDQGSVVIDFENEFNFSSNILVSDQHIYIFGHTTYSADETPLITRLNLEGSLDTTFGDDGVLFLEIEAGGNEFVKDAKLVGNSIVLLTHGTNSLMTNEGWGDTHQSFSRLPKIVEISLDGSLLSNRIYNSDLNYIPTAFVKNSTDNLFIGNLLSNSGYDQFISSAISQYLTDGNLSSRNLIDGVLSTAPLYGTDGDDIIYSGNSAEIYAGSGNDVISSGSRSLKIAGHAYYVNAGPGDDKVWGSHYDDILIGGSGHDYLSGQGGNDQMYLGSEGGEAVGFDGEDTIFIPYATTDFLLLGTSGSSSGAALTLLHKADYDVMYYVSAENLVFTNKSLKSTEYKNEFEILSSDAKIKYHPYFDGMGISLSSQPLNLQLQLPIRNNIIVGIDGNHIINGGYSDGRVGLFSKGVSFVDGKSGIDNLWVSNRVPVKIYRFESLYLLIDESRESYIYLTNIEKIRSYIEGYSNSDEMDDYRLDSYDIQDVDSFSELTILSKNISYLPIATDQINSDLVFKVDENESKELSVHIFLEGSEALDDFKFKWFKNGVEILGETESTYKLGARDQGSSFYVQVLYSAEGQIEYTFNSVPITTLEPIYTITSGAESYGEGQSALFNLVTTNLAAGTSIAYTLSGISASDLVNNSLTGTASVSATGTTVISLPLTADALTEGAETLTITLDDSPDKTASLTIIDTSISPSYRLSAVYDSRDEGSTAYFSLVTKGIDAGTSVAYTISGVSAADLISGSLNGTIKTAAAGLVKLISIPIRKDNLTEGDETLTITLDDSSSTTASLTINDTSEGPTYSITPGSESYDEGQSALFSLVTTNLAAGTSIAYTVSGVSASDLVSNSLTGTATVSATGTTVISLPLTADALTEGAETLMITLDDSPETTASLMINDSSKTPVVDVTLYRTTILGDKNILGPDPVLIKALTENITKTDGVISEHFFLYAGARYDYSDIDSLITVVTRNGEFTDEFSQEISDYASSLANATYSDVVQIVGSSGIDGWLIKVAGDDGNYIG